MGKEILTAFPQGITRLNKLLSNNYPLRYSFDEKTYAFFFADDLDNTSAQLRQTISAETPKQHNKGSFQKQVFNALQRALPALEQGQYVRLVCESKDIVVSQYNDLSRVSNINGQETEMYAEATDIPNEITVSSFHHNVSLVLDSLKEYPSKNIVVQASGGQGFTIIRNEYFWKDIELSSTVTHELSTFGDDLNPSNEVELIRFLDEVSDIGVIKIAGRSDLVVMRNEIEEPAMDVKQSDGSLFEKPENDSVTGVNSSGEGDVTLDSTEADNAGKVKRLKFVSEKHFEDRFRTLFSKVNKGEVPQAVRDGDNQVLAIILPVILEEELRSSIPAKKLFTDRFDSDAERFLRDVSEYDGSVEICEKGKGTVGLMVSGSKEQLVLETVKDESAIFEDAPAEADVEPEALPDVKADDNTNDDVDIPDDTADVEINYSYQVIKISKVSIGVKELREDLRKEIISIFIDDKKGVGVFIPKTLVGRLSDNGIDFEETTTNQLNKRIKDSVYTDSNNQTLLSITPQASFIPGKADFSSKEPYGFLSWQSALDLEARELLPEILDEIKNSVTKAFGSNQLETVQQPAEKDKKREPKEDIPLQNKREAELVIPKAVNGSSTQKGITPLGIELGSIVAVDSANLDIAGKLRALKAAKELDSTIQGVKNLLNESDSFVPIKTTDSKFYITANSELSGNVEGISEMFGIGYTTVVVGDKGKKASWSNVFEMAVEGNEFILIQDSDLNKDALVIPQSEKIMNEVLPALGIQLES